MQIIESTVLGVRSAVHRLEAGNTSPRFIVFPMIHVAEQRFYDDVLEQLEACEIILFEGVASSRAAMLTRAYRWFSRNPELNLVLQNTMDLTHLRDRMVHADVSGQEFDRRWARLPFFWRMAMPIAAPAVGLYLRYFGTRAIIADGLAMNLKKTRKEILSGDDDDPLKNLVLDWRDEHLVSVIDREWKKVAKSGACIGIVFGAGHMRAVLRHLLKKQGYRVVKSEWLTVFTL